MERTMSMISKKIIIIAGVAVVLGLLIYFPGKKWARAHANYMTAAEDHPLNCISCHLYKTDNPVIKRLVNKDYLSPINLAISPGDKFLYVVVQDAGELLAVDVEKNEVIRHIKVGNHPHSIALSADGKTAFVSNQWSDYVSVVDLGLMAETDSLVTGNGPSGLSLTSDGKYLYVVNGFGADVSVIDLSSKEEVRRLPVGNDPAGIAQSPDGGKFYITSRRAIIVPFGEPMASELAEINGKSRRLEAMKRVESAYMMENITFTPSGDLALMTLIRPKNLLPTVQVEGGWIMNHGFGIVEQDSSGRIIQLLIDEPNSYYADPFDIVISPDGKKAFISSAGVNRISVIDIDSVRALIHGHSTEELDLIANNLGISKRYVTKRIPTGSSPKGLALSADGKRLFVAEQLNDKIGVINTETLEYTDAIDLGGPKKITVSRKGRRLFANAGGTFQNQYSCYTCHPDNHEDGLIYNMAGKDMGRNTTNTMSLRDINGTDPFKWNGKNQTVYKQDGMRFSTVLTRTEAFSYPDLDALASYILTGIENPPNLMYNPEGELTASQLKGKAIFERCVDNYGKEIPENGRCVTCHPAPYFSHFQYADVGTLASSDDSILFDTPHLNNIFASAPYLHDGRAKTLEEIWTLYGGQDRHGVVNDLTKMDLNNLVNYLKSLRSATNESKENKVIEASK